MVFLSIQNTVFGQTRYSFSSDWLSKIFTRINTFSTLQIIMNMWRVYL